MSAAFDRLEVADNRFFVDGDTVVINCRLITRSRATSETLDFPMSQTVLGTAFTMEHEFYKGRLAQQHGLNVIVPGVEDRATVHRIIYDELVAGKVLPASRESYRAIIARLIEGGAEAVILGCTEIMLLVQPEDSAVPIFDTTALHANAAIEMALAN